MALELRAYENRLAFAGGSGPLTEQSGLRGLLSTDRRLANTTPSVTWRVDRTVGSPGNGTDLPCDRGEL